MADPADFLVDPKQPWDVDDARPIGFVDLARCSGDVRAEPRPYPLIGLGDPHHPLGPTMDAMIETPVTADAMLRNVLQAPNAAVVATHMLRSMSGIEASAALSIESIGYGLLQGSAEHRAWLASRAPSVAVPAGKLHLRRRGTTLHLLIDRPGTHNAIDVALRDALAEAFALAALDPDIDRVTLAATGAAFSIGGDLAEFGTTRDPASAHRIRSRTLPARVIVASGVRFEAHVQGACVGAGLEIAAFADRLTASPRAWFQLPELAMGLVPGAGGCVSVPRRIGRQRTALMILSGRRIGAAVALRWGLIDAIEDRPPADEGGADA